MIKQWGLKRAGGLDDQPAGLMDKITIALNTYNAMKSFLQNKNNFAEWAERNPSFMDIWLEVKGLRKNGK